MNNAYPEGDEGDDGADYGQCFDECNCDYDDEQCWEACDEC